MQSHSPLQRLAGLAGILSEYVDQSGTETRLTSDETRRAILEAMGIDTSSPSRIEEALRALEVRVAERVVDPVRVVEASNADRTRVVLRGREDVAGPLEWQIEFIPEAGEPYQLAGVARPEWNGSALVTLPEPPAEGYHTLRVAARLGGEERRGEQSLIVVPGRCPSVHEVAGRERVAGITANLYTLRSAGNWGIGDFSDLGYLLEWTAATGGAFVGVNPLHALRNTGGEISPYSPVSRVFRNPVYLDVSAVPELEYSTEARALVDSAPVARECAALRASARVDYPRVQELKRRVLEALHAAFTDRRSEGDPRRRAYHAFLEAQGEHLILFATFEALADHFGSGNWRAWPQGYRDPRSPATRAFQAEYGQRIAFHCWLQFELDRQLAAAAARGRQAGLPIGLYQDLAIGASPDGADVWANPGLFVDGVSIGAPPDDYSASGQNWGLPALHPGVLHETAYRYWITLVRASMRHSGALRIDHAMGLFRQFWIPNGMSGRQGAYVRFPSQDLLGILALEAKRQHAIVVGEDLGTVPPEVPPTLHLWGILSSRVFYFEREGTRYRSAVEYEPMALTTANTHDMPTLAGFWRGRDIELKRELGIIESDDAARELARARIGEKRAVLERLAAEGLLAEPRDPTDNAEVRAAIHDFLCRTPSVMVGLSLDDLVGEVEPVNVPGTQPEQFSAWTRKLATPIETLSTDEKVRAALRCDRLTEAG